MSARAYVLPRANRSTLCHLAGGGYRDGRAVTEIAPVPMPLLAPHVLDLDAGLLVYGHGNEVHILSGVPGPASDATVRLPRGHKVHALTLHEGVVYVGGSGGKEILGSIDLRARPAWTAIAVPREVAGFGKAVDGFVRDGARLVAVDDFVLPRYFLVYDIREARAPRLLEARPFPWSLSAEQVTGVASAGSWMAVLSDYANHGYMGSQIGLVHVQTLRGHAALWVRRAGSLRARAQPALDVHGVALSGTTLYVAAGADGLGALDIAEWVAQGPVQETVEIYEGKKGHRTERREAFAPIPLTALHRTAVPDGPVQAVVAAEGGAFAVVGTQAGLHALWVPR